MKKLFLALALVAVALVSLFVKPAVATPPVLDPVAYSSKAASASAQLCSVVDSSERLVGISIMATTSSDTSTEIRLYNGTSTSGTLVYSGSLGQNGSRTDPLPRIQCPLGIYMEIVTGHADVTALVQTGTPY